MTAAPRDASVLVDGLRLHYRDWGGVGEPIVLVHGLASNCRFWDLVAPILAAHFTVVALDQRGHGQSDKPDDGYDFATVASDLRGFIDAIGLSRPLIVGHSWGGNVAVELAASYPSVPKGICLIDGGTIEVSAVSGMSLEKARVELAPPDLSGLTVEQLLEGAKSHWPLGASMTRQLEEFLLANFETQEDKTIRSRLSRVNHMKVVDALWDNKPSAVFHMVKCPVLLMPARQVGGQDPDGGRPDLEDSVARAARLVPTSKTVWLEDSIHDVPLQRPELVAQVIVGHIRDGFFGA